MHTDKEVRYHKQVNSQQLVKMLQQDPSDECVGTAIAWLKTRKSTSKEAQNVLQELFKLQQIEASFGWLANWLKDGSWKALRFGVYSVTSVAFYDWIIHLLEDNPTHPEAGELWSEMIHRFRDRDLNQSALLWLENYGDMDENAGSVAAALLNDIASEAVVMKARKYLDRDREDRQLFSSLIQNTSDEFATKLGLSYLKRTDLVSGAFVSVALLQSDGEKHSTAVEKFFRKHWEHRHMYNALETIALSRNTVALKILSDWLDEHPDSSKVPTLLQQNVSGTNSQRLADQAWNWCANNLENTEINLFLVLVLRAGKGVQVPEEAIQYVKNMLQSNKSANLWTALAVSLLQILSPDECYKFGTELLDQTNEENRRRTILATLLERVNDAALISLAKAQCKSLPANQCIPLTMALMENDPDEAIIAQAKASIPSGDSVMDWLLTAQLVKAGDKASIARSKEWLKERHISLRFDSTSPVRLALMLALLESNQYDQDVIKEAEDWMSFRPPWYEQKEHGAVCAAIARIKNNQI